MGLRDSLKAMQEENRAQNAREAEWKLAALSAEDVMKKMSKADGLITGGNQTARDMALLEALNANTEAVLLVLAEVRKR